MATLKTVQLTLAQSADDTAGWRTIVPIGRGANDTRPCSAGQVVGRTQAGADHAVADGELDISLYLEKVIILM